jgi:hypothetical protein
MDPLVSAVVTWLNGKFPAAKAFPAPNNALSVRVDDTQYDVFFIETADDAMTASSSIRSMVKYPLSQKRVGVIVATSQAIADDPQIQSAVMSNYTADAVYLGYLNLQEVKKWPPTAP